VYVSAGPGAGGVVQIVSGSHVIASTDPAETLSDPSLARWLPGKLRPDSPHWNASIGAVGGAVMTGGSQALCAIDVKTGAPQDVTSRAAMLPKRRNDPFFAPPDGRRAAVAGIAGVGLFALDTGKSVATLPPLGDDSDFVNDAHKGNVDGMNWGPGD